MKKEYRKPSIEVLDYAQRDAIASCGAWISGETGKTCNSVSFEDYGMVSCNPNFPYNG